jgi:hypothetical protein
MKKLLLALLGVGVIQVASAATATTSFNINGTLANSCTASMSVATVSLPDLSVATPGTTAVQVNCRAGTLYSMNVASTNGWKLMNGADSLAYSISYTGSASGVNSAWSGTSGDTAPLAVTTSNQTGTGAQQAYNLSIVNAIAAATLPAGTYSDTVTVNINYS